eukprot:SM000009S23524  [mRNA]  locus=s9:505817:507279:- [translate_table: standard]
MVFDVTNATVLTSVLLTGIALFPWQPDSFAALQQEYASADLSGISILLCVGNKADRAACSDAACQDPRSDASGRPLSAPVAGPRGTALDWCLEKGVEYVDASALDSSFDQGLSVDGDQQGLARIRGALAAHMWPNMLLKGRGRGTGTNDGGEVGAGGAHRPSPLSAARVGPLLMETRLMEHAEETPELLSTHEFTAAEHASSNGGAEEHHMGAEDVASSPHMPRDCVNGDNEEEGSPGAAVEDLEKLMQEMAGMRAQLAGLPDDERRGKAASIAMRMARLLNLDDDDIG